MYLCTSAFICGSTVPAGLIGEKAHARFLAAVCKQVVVEILEDGQVVEFVGLLQEYSGKYLLLRNVALQPGVDIGQPLPGHFDVIFPRSHALVRHCLGG